MQLTYRTIGSFKGLLFILAVAIVAAVVIYTNHIVAGLRQNARRHLTAQVDRLRLLFLQGGDVALDTYLTEMQSKDFPLIVSDREGMPISWSGIPKLEALPFEQAQDAARGFIADWRRIGNHPIPIELTEFGLVYYFHYGESPLIRRLKVLPWIEVLIVGGLILIGYFGFVSIKKSEERSVWVGMARETAHQMGTPLTGLMGWVEVLTERGGDGELIGLMTQDLERLRTVADRFGQIGSPAALVEGDIADLVAQAAGYVQRRLPQISAGDVTVRVSVPKGLRAKINPMLFSWVVENLMRNAVESLRGGVGAVTVSAAALSGRTVIEVADTGVGIPRSEWRNVFRPGYTTKARGWGLGLSLARRIVEDIHRGKIYIAESRPGRGTTVRIELNA